MASHSKKAQALARQLFKASLVDNVLSTERVGGVLSYVEKHKPANPVMVLKAYQRYVVAEVARSRALVDHAGPVGDGVLASIATAMTKKYGRQITSVGRRNDSLLAGLRVRVGDDVYESSIASQLETLSG